MKNAAKEWSFCPRFKKTTTALSPSQGSVQRGRRRKQPLEAETLPLRCSFQLIIADLVKGKQIDAEDVDRHIKIYADLCEAKAKVTSCDAS